MVRYAKSGVTKEDLKAKIDSCDDLRDLLYSSQIQSDLNKVEFDLENFTCNPDEPFRMPGYGLGYDCLDNDVPVLWCAAGGDWEYPVAFCMYIDDNDNLRAYVPMNGNIFNIEMMSAFGNNDDSEMMDDDAEFDMDMLRQDASSRIVVKN